MPLILTCSSVASLQRHPAPSQPPQAPQQDHRCRHFIQIPHHRQAVGDLDPAAGRAVEVVTVSTLGPWSGTGLPIASALAVGYPYGRLRGSVDDWATNWLPVTAMKTWGVAVEWWLESNGVFRVVQTPKRQPISA